MGFPVVASFGVTASRQCATRKLCRQWLLGKDGCPGGPNGGCKPSLAWAQSTPPPNSKTADALSFFTEVLEAEMTEALGAEKGERTAGRLGYRSGGRF